MTESIAAYIHESGELPEGTRDALTMLSALLTGRRECAVICRVQSPGEGLNRSSSEAGHEKALSDFTRIHKTLQNAVASVSPRSSPSYPLEEGMSHAEQGSRGDGEGKSDAERSRRGEENCHLRAGEMYETGVAASG